MAQCAVREPYRAWRKLLGIIKDDLFVGEPYKVFVLECLKSLRRLGFGDRSLGGVNEAAVA
jgi:hypothetical protein